jgi:hypothetical protein
MKNEYEDGWFYGYSPAPELEFIDEDTHRVRFRDSRNVVGRFINHEVVDGVASREARKTVMKPAVVLEMRNLRVPSGTGSSQGTDIATHVIRFDEAYEQESISMIERFPDAWAAFQGVRKSAVSDEERAALSAAGIEQPDRKPTKRKPKPKPNKNPDNVIGFNKKTGA